MTSHLLLIIASLFIIGELSYGDDPTASFTGYIRLDLSPLRGRDVPSNTKAYPRRIPVEPPAEMAIFCTDSAYPNDIFCDVRTYYKTLWNNHSSYINEVAIEYFHPERSDIDCEVSFRKEQGEEYPIISLPYSKFYCWDFNHTQVPVFQILEASYLTITNDVFCSFRFKNGGRVTKSVPKGRRVTVIKFEYDMYGCPMSLVGGRPTPQLICENDGRRCRPVNQ